MKYKNRNAVCGAAVRMEAKAGGLGKDHTIAAGKTMRIGG